MKFQLRKGSRKDICPNCGKKTFTPYVNEQGLMLDPSVGFCDRRNKCGYHMSPADFLERRPDMVAKIRDKKYKTSDFKRSYGQRPGIRTVRRKPPTFFKPELVALSMNHYEMNSLVMFLRWFFGKHDMAAHFETVRQRYYLGTSKKFRGSPVFWLIDSDWRVRDGKIMGYTDSSGRRIKVPHPMFSNVHTEIEKKTSPIGLMPSREYQKYFTGADNVKREFKPCFYGSHLANQYPELPIWLFESEKAALVVATFLEWGGTPIGIPMATGGCAALNPTPSAFADPYDKHQVLKDREVVLFPDHGMLDDWWRKGEMLNGFAKKVWCSTLMNRMSDLNMPRLTLEPGDALDDLLMKCVNTGHDPAELLLKCYGFGDEVKCF